MPGSTEQKHEGQETAAHGIIHSFTHSVIHSFSHSFIHTFSKYLSSTFSVPDDPQGTGRIVVNKADKSPDAHGIHSQGAGEDEEVGEGQIMEGLEC